VAKDCASGTCSAGTCAAIPSAVVTGNGSHTCALSPLGHLKCWGSNFYGELGIGTKSTSMLTAPPAAPVNFGTGRVAKRVALGPTQTCAILDDDTLRCWGSYLYGALGIVTNNFSDTLAPLATPVDVGAGRTVKAVSTEFGTTCAILDDDSLKCWGDNNYGQLGLGNTSDRETPALTPVNLGAGRTAAAVAVGSGHVCAILDDGTVKCWGENFNGKLGTGDTVDLKAPRATPIDLGAGRTATRISGGSYHTCAILDDGTAKCWGQNNVNAQGTDGPLATLSPTAMKLGAGRTAKELSGGVDETCVVLDNDTVTCFGFVGFGSAPAAINVGVGRTVRFVSASKSYRCAHLDNDTFKCWGENGSGQLGLGNTVDTSAPGNALTFAF